MQQANGRQEPEAQANKTRTASETASESASQLVSRSWPNNEVEAKSSYLPWLETVGSRPSTGISQTHAETGNSQHFRPFRPSESLAALIHDTRNMVSTIDLYCDLLEEPGVLTNSFHHYAGELRLVGGAGRRLLEKLSVLDFVNGHTDDFAMDTKDSKPALSFASRTEIALGRSETMPDESHAQGEISNRIASSFPVPEPASNVVSLSRPGRAKLFQTGQPIQSLAEELQANQNILSAIAGPGIGVTLSISGGHRPIAMAGDDLTRILVNLCRNAVEVMPDGGNIEVALTEGRDSLLLTFADNGPGISDAALEAIFSPGFTSHAAPSGGMHSGAGSASGPRLNAWPAQHRGLGLAIVRSIVSAAGGSVWAANRTDGHTPVSGTHLGGGAVIFLEFPLNERHQVS